MRSLLILALLSLSACNAIETESGEESGKDEKLFEGRRLKWEEDGGLEIEIIKPIKKEDCKLKSRPNDVIEQFYRLEDKEGNEIGSNFGKEVYRFTLGKDQVIAGMDRAMTGMCLGEQRKVVIPPKLGFDKKTRESYKIEKDQTLYYTVELVDLFRPKPGKTWTTDEGIKIKVIHQIDEDECIRSKPGDTIHQHYKLWLENGNLVESTYIKNEPFVFKLGANEVVKGMDIAMSDMCEGDQRQLTIPPEYAYGDKSSDDIPAKSTLYFTVTLVKLIKRDEL